MTIRAGVIGYGLAGKVFHAPLLQAAGIEVALVSSSRSAEVAQEFPRARVVADPMTVATSKEIDLVVVASPNDTHVPLAKAALQAGRAVVVDKPFTHTVAEAEELMALAQTKNCMLSVFHNRRWDSDFLTLKASIARGDLGEVMSYQCRFDRFRLEVQDRWREVPTPGVGSFYDLGSHLIDQALQLFGRPDWLMADLTMQRPGTRIDDGFYLLMGKGKLRILLAATILAVAPEPKFVVHGTRGSFVKSGMDVQEDQLKSGLRPGHAGFGVEPTSASACVTTMQNGHAEAMTVSTLPGTYVDYYLGIRRALEAGTPPPVRVEEVLDTMRILELACRSHREGVRISL